MSLGAEFSSFGRLLSDALWADLNCSYCIKQTGTKRSSCGMLHRILTWRICPPLLPRRR